MTQSLANQCVAASNEL